MKKIIIYTTNDEIISLKLVNQVISSHIYKDYKIDILISKPNFIRKIKILFVILLFGSIKNLFKKLRNKITINDILKKNGNCKLVNQVNKNYDYGLSIYCTSKISIENFKIYNFHLGNLKTQRGSFIFFYKFIKNWKNVYLTFHEIGEKYDVGKILNERKINLDDNCAATDIIFAYLENIDFLNESIKLIRTVPKKEYTNYDKLHLVPSFPNLLCKILIYYLKRLKSFINI